MLGLSVVLHSPHADQDEAAARTEQHDEAKEQRLRSRSIGTMPTPKTAPLTLSKTHMRTPPKIAPSSVPIKGCRADLSRSLRISLPRKLARASSAPDIYAPTPRVTVRHVRGLRSALLPSLRGPQNTLESARTQHELALRREAARRRVRRVRFSVRALVVTQQQQVQVRSLPCVRCDCKACQDCSDKNVENREEVNTRDNNSDTEFENDSDVASDTENEQRHTCIRAVQRCESGQCTGRSVVDVLSDACRTVSDGDRSEAGHVPAVKPQDEYTVTSMPSSSCLPDETPSLRCMHSVPLLPQTPRVSIPTIQTPTSSLNVHSSDTGLLSDDDDDEEDMLSLSRRQMSAPCLHRSNSAFDDYSFDDVFASDGDDEDMGNNTDDADNDDACANNGQTRWPVSQRRMRIESLSVQGTICPPPRSPLSAPPTQITPTLSLRTRATGLGLVSASAPSTPGGSLNTQQQHCFDSDEDFLMKGTVPSFSEKGR
ncbi:MAG: hypothetical protein MHM6MM_000670 [Cercozoa sp. M6MM]